MIFILPWIFSQWGCRDGEGRANCPSKGESATGEDDHVHDYDDGHDSFYDDNIHNNDIHEAAAEDGITITTIIYPWSLKMKVIGMILISMSKCYQRVNTEHDQQVNLSWSHFVIKIAEMMIPMIEWQWPRQSKWWNWHLILWQSLCGSIDGGNIYLSNPQKFFLG